MIRGSRIAGLWILAFRLDRAPGTLRKYQFRLICPPQLYRPLHNFQSKSAGFVLERVVRSDSATIQLLDGFGKEFIDTVIEKEQP